MPEPSDRWPEIKGRVGLIRCRGCGAELAICHEVGKRTAIPRDGMIVYQAALRCPGCGAVRHWHSELMSAIRLGIVEAGG